MGLSTLSVSKTTYTLCISLSYFYHTPLPSPRFNSIRKQDFFDILPRFLFFRSRSACCIDPRSFDRLYPCQGFILKKTRSNIFLQIGRNRDYRFSIFLEWFLG